MNRHADLEPPFICYRPRTELHQYPWMPKDRYQATRNRTCSTACKGQLISRTAVRVKKAPTLACATCGVLMHRPASQVAGNAATYCSYSCRGKMSALKLVRYSGNMKGRSRAPQYGPANPAWKGGVTLKRPKGNYKGVRYVRAPAWALPMARKDGYIMEHRLVMAQTCGFLLTRTEVVDHEDHNPSNNAPGNLKLYPTNADHKRGEVGRFVPGVANRVCQRGLGPL